MCVCVGGGGGEGSSGETKIAEGMRDAKNSRFVLYIAFAGKSGGGGGYSPLSPPPMCLVFLVGLYIEELKNMTCKGCNDCRYS